MTRAALRLSPKTVIFDYGEVISLRPSQADRTAIEQLAGVDPEKFWASYWGHRAELDLARDGVRPYWDAISADTGASWDDGRIVELWSADLRSWMSVNPATVDVLADLKAGGTRLALLSNAAPDYGSFFRHGVLGDYFDACYLSGELKLLKPSAAIYQHVLADLGISPADAVFIDNREDNVTGAQELGITGHVFTDAGTLRAFLSSLASA
ncbi:MAG TPA: HAD family phosphatase [Trebonia sp.]|nr:HAD family phosphatase [Trebonia sp.]